MQVQTRTYQAATVYDAALAARADGAALIRKVELVDESGMFAVTADYWAGVAA